MLVLCRRSCLTLQQVESWPRVLNTGLCSRSTAALTAVAELLSLIAPSAGAAAIAERAKGINSPRRMLLMLLLFLAASAFILFAGIISSVARYCLYEAVVLDPSSWGCISNDAVRRGWPLLFSLHPGPLPARYRSAIGRSSFFACEVCPQLGLHVSARAIAFKGLTRAQGLVTVRFPRRVVFGAF